MEKPHQKITHNECQALHSWVLTYATAVGQMTSRQETGTTKMVALPYYLHLYDNHEAAMNKVPYNNENDKRAGNCEHLSDVT